MKSAVSKLFKSAINEPIYHGEIVHWNDKKGYGFIKTANNEPNIFFHISAFAYQNQRPKKGEQVCFTLQTTEFKTNAKRVLLSGHESGLFDSIPYDLPGKKAYLAEAAVYILLDMLFYAVLSTISIPITLTSLIISGLTFILYSLDKHASLNNHQRIPEASLHIAALLGGWPGALIARPLLRHKTKKNRFIIFFWMSIIVNFFCLYLITWYSVPFA